MSFLTCAGLTFSDLFSTWISSFEHVGEETATADGVTDVGSLKSIWDSFRDELLIALLKLFLAFLFDFLFVELVVGSSVFTIDCSFEKVSRAWVIFCSTWVSTLFWLIELVVLAVISATISVDSIKTGDWEVAVAVGSKSTISFFMDNNDVVVIWSEIVEISIFSSIDLDGIGGIIVDELDELAELELLVFNLIFGFDLDDCSVVSEDDFVESFFFVVVATADVVFVSSFIWVGWSEAEDVTDEVESLFFIFFVGLDVVEDVEEEDDDRDDVSVFCLDVLSFVDAWLLPFSLWWYLLVFKKEKTNCNITEIYLAIKA